MNAYTISIKKISTQEVSIINTNPPSGEQLLVKVNRNIRKIEDSYFLCILTVSIYRESDKDKADHDFLIKYVIRSVVTCDDSNASADELQDTITKELYPHLRAGVSAVMGAAGIEPVLLPTLSI